MKFFRNGYEMTLNRVHDTVTIKEGDERLTLSVNGDAMHMIAGINKANQKLQALTDDSKDEEVIEAAEYFAAVIFGREQAARLMRFYANDPGCVISVCGQYFKERLVDRIVKVQKKAKL